AALRHRGAQLAGQPRHRTRVRHGRGDLEGSRLLHDLLPRRTPVDPAVARRGRFHRGRVAGVLLPPRGVPAAHAHDALRDGERGHQLGAPRRPHLRDDAGRAQQCDLAAALPHLPGGIQLLGHGLRGGAHHRVAGGAGGDRHRAVRVPRQAGALPMTLSPALPQGGGRMLETLAAWILGFLWILPLLYAFWTAFHPGEFSTRFELMAPLTLDNFRRAWEAAPFARYFLNSFMLVTMVLAVQLVLCTLAGYAFARFDFPGKD